MRETLIERRSHKEEDTRAERCLGERKGAYDQKTGVRAARWGEGDEGERNQPDSSQ